MSEGYVGVRGYRKPSPEQQRDLIERMKAGDKEAREQFICSNMPMVFPIARKYCNTINIDDAIQEGAIKLWKLAEHYDSSKGELSTLAVISIKRRIRDVIKGESRRPLTFIDPTAAELTDAFFTSNDIFEDKSVYERLRNEIIDLPLYERAVLTFHYGLYGTEPMSLRDVANQLKMSHEMARKHEKKAVETLKRRLQECA